MAASATRLLTALLAAPAAAWVAGGVVIGDGWMAPCGHRAAAHPTMAATLPRTTSEMVDQLRGSVQAALQARTSRMVVELPAGFDFGVETKQKGEAGLSAERSDRELARLFLEMFDGTGIDPVVLFSNGAQVSTCKRRWTEKHSSRVFALYGDSAAPPSPLSKAKAKRGKGAAAKSKGGGGGFGAPPPPPPEASGLARVPSSAEVTFVVDPRQAQLAALRDFCESNGDERLVVLLNPRALGGVAAAGDESLSEIADRELAGYFCADRFEPAFVFRTTAAQGEGETAVLWRAFPDPYVLARKPKIGPPRELLREGSMPDGRAIAGALEDDEKSSAGAKVMGALGTVFGGIDGKKAESN